MAKYLTKGSGGAWQEVTPVASSAGAGDAGKMAQLDSGGKWDISMMPTGLGADIVSCPASEALSAGDFVNFHNDAGTLKARKALAADGTKPAHGFVMAGVSSGATAQVYVRGINSAASGTFTASNFGQPAFLSPSTGGAATATEPSAAGQLSQVLGTVEGISPTKINYTANTPVLLA